MDNDLKVFIPKFEFVNKNINLSNHLSKRPFKHKIINKKKTIIILIFLFIIINNNNQSSIFISIKIKKYK